MVTMEQLQAYMQKAAQADKEKKFVNVSGATLEDALREAAVELGIGIKRIEYEVLEKGSAGVLGVGKRPFLIVAYPAQQQSEILEGEDSVDLDFGFDTSEPEQKDGEPIVRLTPDGVMLKVTPPIGDGEPATEREAIQAISRRTSEKVDTAMVAKIVKRADSVWVKAGDYPYNPANDAFITTDITEGEMKATVVLSQPGPGGADPTADGIRAALESSGVIHGILDDTLNSLEDYPRYREPVVVAEGSKPVHGEDARMVYNFKTDNKHAQLQQTKEGRVDFKELNRIENVVEGQVLARKAPAKQGEPGQTVTGRLIPAKDGKDIDPPLGPNTRLSDDGRSVLAEINGLVKLVSGKITVEKIYVVEGDVNMKEGNIRFLGTVIVKGSVDDGFSVNAAGDIEVMGNVGKGNLEAEGDIIVHQGIAGKGEAQITAGGNIWAKFIENANAQAGDMVVVSDGILNSNVYSDKRIICRGKRASIAGGHVRAAEEIDTKNLGAPAGTETLVEVGYDPKSRERLLELETTEQEYAKQLEEIALNMGTIETMRKNKRKITPEKMKHYSTMKAQREKITKQHRKVTSDIKAIQAYLDELKTNGRISVSGTVFSGVKVAIKDAALQVRRESRSVTYISEGGQVKVTKYEESRADITMRKRESGDVNSAN